MALKGGSDALLANKWVPLALGITAGVAVTVFIVIPIYAAKAQVASEDASKAQAKADEAEANAAEDIIAECAAAAKEQCKNMVVLRAAREARLARKCQESAMS